jgi:adenylosuccinate synthase
MFSDFVIGLQYGDEGKGKVAASLAAQCNYDIVARYNGGPNAGHSVAIGNKNIALHQIPTGALYKKTSYIGPGTVLSFTKLEKEAKAFEEIMGFSPYEYLKISPKAIIINEDHVTIDKANQALTQGSTSSGIAPAYADFYSRNAHLASEYSWPYKDKELISELPLKGRILFEGAQGHYLNPYQGNYPYTTSSSSHPGSAAMTFGFPTSNIENIIGVAKCYETRSGIDPFFHRSDDTSEDKDCFNLIAELGNEIGVTTGRNRGIRWLNATKLIEAINETGTNILVLQKWDILAQTNLYKYYHNETQAVFYSLEFMQEALAALLKHNCRNLEQIKFSSSPQPFDLTW